MFQINITLTTYEIIVVHLFKAEAKIILAVVMVNRLIVFYFLLSTINPLRKPHKYFICSPFYNINKGYFGGFLKCPIRLFLKKTH